MNIVVFLKKTLLKLIVTFLLLLYSFIVDSQELFSISENRYAYNYNHSPNTDCFYKDEMNYVYNQSPLLKIYPIYEDLIPLIPFQNVSNKLQINYSTKSIQNLNSKDTICLRISNKEKYQEFLDLKNPPFIKLLLPGIYSDTTLIYFLKKLELKNQQPKEIFIKLSKNNKDFSGLIRELNKIKDLKLIFHFQDIGSGAEKSDYDFLKEYLTNPECSTNSIVLKNLSLLEINRENSIDKLLLKNNRIKELEIHFIDNYIEVDSNLINNIFQLKQLEKLSLNNVSIRLNNKISNLQNLKYLQLKINNDFPKQDTTNYLNNLRNLEEIYLLNYGGDINKVVNENVKLRLISLSKLVQFNKKVTNLSVNFEKLKRLEVLNLFYGYNIQFNISKLRSLKKIEIGNVSNYRQNLRLLNKLSRIRNLKEIIYINAFNDTICFKSKKMILLYYDYLPVFTRLFLSSKDLVYIQCMTDSDYLIQKLWGWLIYKKNYYSSTISKQQYNKEQDYFKNF